MPWITKLRSTFRSLGRLSLVAASLVALVLIIAWMSGFFRQKVPPGKNPFERPLVGHRRTLEVESLETVQTVDAVGTVQPRRKTDVASRLLATINEIRVNPGDRVQVGQILCTLDDREVQAQLREAEAAAAGMEADLAVREREHDRYRRMFAEKAVTKEDFDRIEGAYRMAQAQLDRAREQANRVRIMLSYTKIEAQTAGVVADRYVDPGDLAVPGKPLLTIHDPRHLELHANVREGLSHKVGVGMQMQVTIDSLERTMMGTIHEIVPRASTTSRSLLVKVTLPENQVAGLYIGTFGRLSIPVDHLDRIVVRSDAVQRVGQLILVDVVLDDDSMERRFVCVGEPIDDKLEILSGLSLGETVAVPDADRETTQ